ncbi:PilZ domain-containing protein [Quadrisphaera granulorum]|uniref:PilZ domain-containing protein n=1 Tax=Quadrisphaera granulorum TaxID=317664 RepID=UPI001475ECE4|nr:PilZ domain-containing protein [Quadrisphaera granulorum]
MLLTPDQVPPLGGPVRLLPISGGPEQRGTLSDWSTSPAGLVATAVVTLDDAGAASLADEPVWAHLQSARGAAVVLEAVAEGTAIAGELLLTGVLALATEQQRAEPRADIARRAQLRGRVAAAARTIDLSRTGARVVLATDAALANFGASADDHVELVVEVDAHETVVASARVVRVDAQRSEVALSFIDLPDADATRIERAVLGQISSDREQAGVTTSS